MTKETHPHQLHFLNKEKSVHWCLFGIKSDTRKTYLLEVNGNECTQTEVISIEDARRAWTYYKTIGFREVKLKDAGGIPLHLDQRIREWWKFANRVSKDCKQTDDPWTANIERTNDAKMLSEIADGKYLRKTQHEEEEQYADYWEYRAQEEDESDEKVADEESDYANQRNTYDCEDDDHDFDESYQEWAMEEEQRDEGMKQAMEEYYASYE